jgi:hypothetical protein
MDMNQRIILILGIFLLLLGCMSSLFLGLKITNAYLGAIFCNVEGDPRNQFREIQPLLLLGKNETASVSATISNSAGYDRVYFAHVRVYGVKIDSPDDALEVAVPGGQTTEITWTITPIEGGSGEIEVTAIELRAISRKDRASFSECRPLVVISGPLTGRQALLLSLISIFAGAVLLFPHLYAKMRERAKSKREL